MAWAPYLVMVWELAAQFSTLRRAFVGEERVVDAFAELGSILYSLGQRSSIHGSCMVGPT